jgi:hypothetical protein
MLRHGFIATVILCAPTAASADWQYAKWGMTPAQVVAASKGEASMYRGGGRNFGCAYTNQTPFATAGNKNLGGVIYDITFCSDATGRLSSVAVRATGGVNGPEVKRALLSQYGQPISDRGGDTIWRDTKNRNTVTFSEYAIEYKPLGGGGL